MFLLASVLLAACAHAMVLSTRTSGIDRMVAYMGKFHVDRNTGPYTPLLPIAQNNSGITDVILFVCDLHSTQPYFTVGGPAPNDTDFLGPLWSEVAQLQDAGINVLASLGGYGADSYILLQNDFDFYYPILRDFLVEYQLDGLDMDIEPTSTGLQPTPWGQSIVRLLIQLRDDFGPNFLITMAPVAQDLTLVPALYSGFDYKVIDNEAVINGTHVVNWFNGQFYSGYGDCGDTTTHDQCVANGFAADRVVMLVPADSQDATPWCDIATVTSVAGELASKYPTFGGMGALRIIQLTPGGYQYTYAGSSDNITNIQWYQRVTAAMK